MEPVMKFVDVGGKTQYLLHAERVVDISDIGKPDKPAATMTFESLGENFVTRFSIDGVTARDLKRNIQDNASEEIGFLKLDYNTDVFGKNARRYVNVDWLVSIHAENFHKLVDGQRVQVGGARILGRHTDIHIEGAAFAIAAQIRRVLKRLDQDEEFCCNAPEPETDDSE